jgi:hypothetical protein
MTITTADCINAIKNSKSINPLLSYANDWDEISNFTTSLDETAVEMRSDSMDETIYVVEHSYGIEITHTRPDIEWAYEVQPYDQWPDYDTVLFKVFDTAGNYQNEYIESHINTLPPGSIEISEGMFTNNNFTEHNFNWIMEDAKFKNHTPDLGQRSERPEPTEEGCGADECCGGSCSLGLSFELEDDSDLVEDFWYYEIITDEADGEYINITSKAYWEKYGYLDDRNASDALEQALPPGFSELEESTFDYNGDMADAKIALDATGKFQEFCFGFY